MRTVLRGLLAAGLVGIPSALALAGAATAAITPSITEIPNPTAFAEPTYITPGPDGNLWFAENRNPGGIGKVTPSGTITQVATGGVGGLSANSHPQDIVAGPDGNLWFIEGNKPPKIGTVNPGTGAVSEVATGGITPNFNANTFLEGLAAGPDGNLWFTELESPSAIGRITPTVIVSEFTSGLSATSEPDQITAGLDGDLWFTEGTTKATPAIGRISPFTGLATEFSSGLSEQARGIAPGPDGNVWFTEYRGPGRIGKITPAGTITEVATGGITPGFSANSNPFHLVVGPEGTLWFTEFSEPSGPGRIGRIDPTTGAVEEFPLPTAPSAPYGIALGPDGNLWFTEVGADNIGRITTPPLAATTGASATGPSTATVSGLLNGHVQATSVHVEYAPLGRATTTTPEQELGVNGGNTPVSLAVGGLAASTTYRARIVVTNPTSSVAGSFVTFTTGPAPAPGVPVVSHVRESASRWREGPKLPQISSRHGRRKHRPPVGATFSFSLNEQASVTFAFTQRVSGRKVGRNCVPKSHGNRKRKACQLMVTRGTLSFTGHPGTNNIVFQGRISGAKTLKPGRYTLVITAANTAGQKSAPQSLGFTIVK
jgi:streptogramin lyase